MPPDGTPHRPGRGPFQQSYLDQSEDPVQKELGLLHLEAGRIPIAISLLTDHLQRNGADFEAYNLLIKCYFLSGRYEAGET